VLTCFSFLSTGDNYTISAICSSSRHTCTILAAGRHLHRPVSSIYHQPATSSYLLGTTLLATNTSQTLESEQLDGKGVCK
jgi:hypothetical protein